MLSMFRVSLNQSPAYHYGKPQAAATRRHDETPKERINSEIVKVHLPMSIGGEPVLEHQGGDKIHFERCYPM